MSFFSRAFGPSSRANRLIAAAAKGGIRGRVARSLLLALHSIDASEGVELGGRLRLPHPTGIVLGRGCKIGRDVTICQGVTVGHTRDGGYPTIEDGVTIFPGAIIVGDITVGAGATIGPNSLVMRSVPPGYSTRAPLAEIREPN